MIHIYVFLLVYVLIPILLFVIRAISKFKPITIFNFLWNLVIWINYIVNEGNTIEIGRETVFNGTMPVTYTYTAGLPLMPWLPLFLVFFYMFIVILDFWGVEG